jgi:uncharacterized metal-binding protein YceD (DUF177 family)
MAKPLTAAVPLATLAGGPQVVEIEERIAEFPRLSEALSGGLAAVDPAHRPANWDLVPVTGRICFDGVDAQSTALAADVTVAVQVPQVCQRCLEAYIEPLAVDTKLIFVREQEAPEREGYENWELDEDRLRPLDLVDELLVMALPFAALHDDDSCRGAATAPEAASEKPLRPFADLRAQMEAASEPVEPEEN